MATTQLLVDELLVDVERRIERFNPLLIAFGCSSALLETVGDYDRS